MKSVLALVSLWTLYTVQAFVALSPSWTTDRLCSTHLHLFNSVQEAIAEAQRVCAIDPTSNECRVAWDVVEELEAADSDRQKAAAASVNGGGANAWGMSVNADALLGSFDILTQKIDGKMDQLKATAEQLQALGADPYAMSELSRLSVEMKQALANAKMTVR